jgi:hypothetical protein
VYFEEFIGVNAAIARARRRNVAVISSMNPDWRYRFDTLM